MQHLSHIFHITAAAVIFLLSSCSNGKTIIPQKTMAGIIGDMYLADQYIEEHPEFRAQMDTLLLYEAVVMRHGYTFNDYRNSVEHYLQKGDALKKIHLRARKSIIKHRDELNEQLRRTPANRERWWAEDSIMTKHVNTLWKEPYLRNFKWLSGTSAKEEWNPTDSVAFDIPSNPIWWENTIMANTGNSPADSLYPILQRDYLIYTERIERQRLLEKDYTPQQKARKRIQERKKAKPDMAKYEISKKMEKEKLKKRTK